MTPSYDAHRLAVEEALAGLFADAWPSAFGEILHYPLRSGGKRVRPVLCRMACEAVGVSAEAAMPAALAVELVHTYSLVHDDLPCMDDDDERRGKPTVHRAFDEGSAVLCGDALLTEAFHVLLTGAHDPSVQVRMVRRLSEAAGHRGMVGGQAADVGLGGTVDTLEALMALHRGKTGALLAVSAELGGLCGAASPDQLQALVRYGEAVGLAFQLADDVLDADEDAGSDGPPSYVKLLGLQPTRQRAAALRDEAIEAARRLPHADDLVALARFVVDRDH
jgi:geranylgeranyl pyrophosphate synthase